MKLNRGDRSPGQQLAGWLGWAGLDAIGRLALLTGSTIVFSRMLSAHDFGVAALILTIVTFAAVFVGAPFEEALTQRRNLRMAHFQAALGASWLVGAVICSVSIWGGAWLASHYNEPAFQLLLPIAMVSIFFGGHSDILTALARRHRRFNDVSYATLMGHVIGIGMSLIIALLGYGIWALIAQRLLVVIARAIILQWRMGFWIVPDWSSTHVGDLARFAGVSFLSRMTDNLTYLAFNALVQAFYGFTTLGYVNMAMRLIEPIRGAIVATGHNLAFSFFARASGDAARFRAAAEDIVSKSAFAIAPVFMGMAAIAPALLPLVAGPGWDEAVDIAICLSIAAAIGVPANFVYTAYSVRARPEFNLMSLIAGFAATAGILYGCQFLGPISVGLSRIAGDSVRALAAVLIPAAATAWPRRERFEALTPALTIAGLMLLLLMWLDLPLRGLHFALRLPILVGAGIIIYGALLALFARPVFLLLLERLRFLAARPPRKVAI